MSVSFAKEIAGLRRLSPKQLRQRYEELFGEPSKSGNVQFLLKRLSWKVQAIAEGDLYERARRRAEELAKGADIRLSPPATLQMNGTGISPHQRFTTDHRIPPAGTILERTYRGHRHLVTVREEGFEHEGEIHKSLSAAARAICGSHCNGFAFFGLGGDL